MRQFYRYIPSVSAEKKHKKSDKCLLPFDLESLFSKHYSTTKYYIEYNGFLANHLSHGMVALHKLNCSIPAIESYMKYYSNKKCEEPSVYEGNNGNTRLLPPRSCQWNELNSMIGKRDNFYGIYEMMQTELNNKHKGNYKELIRDKFPALSNGVAGSLLHCLIHLGYGASIENEQMMLEGLSYLIHSHVPFNYNHHKSNKNSTAYDTLKLIKKEQKLKQCFLTNYDKMAHLANGAGQAPFVCLSMFAQDTISEYLDMFINEIPLLSQNNSNIEQKYKLKKYVLTLMIHLYVYGHGIECNDFILLHGVTSAWSLFEILDCLDDWKDINKSVLEYLSVAIATFVCQFEPDVDIGIEQQSNACMLEFNGNGKPFSDDDWQRLIREMVDDMRKDVENSAFIDEHIYKLVAVILECVDCDIIDSECAYFTIRKAIKYPLIIQTIASNGGNPDMSLFDTKINSKL